ncbi:monofunctional biosynthetic peptidoglycan transglycosylase [Aggregatibacter actinomycetemcomitans]|uniref:monofunctional biosynthetic peptidoglycan transglycosylase n=2 Tax=Aggregatibacter actinomycetemcomitans TaxID=714 RepID=UPI00023FEBBC|nr:monofunctional biosynthetic peptidoglycan transglycosylase [Aggregatibacter actinomycetemcomitans]EHK90344.1 monofunctional biosynthetic peptidoglycan transglycosylase [Aggregatibacter actinomycetemcomitans RhAA1]KNE77408.1 peptidoglycan transglycosylase [Aggregatibacter actinomycetemcomitans RhAA1]MBN6080460.1 monofunctional biosynthetic peptidoglycan transglycosylase [Aggregatibacter actinomycetemcomitans]
MSKKKIAKFPLKRLNLRNLKLRRFTFFRKLSTKSAVRFLCRFLLAMTAITFAFRFVPIPYSTYMLQQKAAHFFSGDFDYETRYDWVSLDEISWQMQLAVIAAEDQNFPEHYGFDFSAIKSAFSHNQKSTRIRGASTISQQTAKNLYLWHGQSWLRKAIEVPTTLMLETLWSKKRILEVYLNIAEFGNGIYGVEAASRFYFKKPAKNLSQNEAALLAAVLPNPIIYKVNAPVLYTKRRQIWIKRQMNQLGKSYLENIN